MKQTTLAILVASLLTATAAGAAVFFASGTDLLTGLSSSHAHGDADDAQHDLHGASGHLHDARTGMLRPDFPPAHGKVPTAQEARSLEQVSRLVIRSDDDFSPANGVRTGSGTLEDPYVITGFYVTGNLHIADTDACVVIKENYIGGQLVLNWNDQCVHVHHNHIMDLRVNQNVKRTGMPTGGLMELNKIDYIGQLRHFDGEFRDNIVGPRTQDSLFSELLDPVPGIYASDVRVALVDGFNQGLLHSNTFYGSVEMKFHGHHHGDAHDSSHSHYHGSDEERAQEHQHDHTERWTSVFFIDNRIIDAEGYGLRYTDRNHAGDDRTANSEDEEELREPHRHYTRVVIARNIVEGGQIWVDVFNADDRLHYDRNPGVVEILDNVVHLQERRSEDLVPLFGPRYDLRSGIYVHAAKELDLLVVSGNRVTFTPAPDDDTSPLGPLWPFQSGQRAPAGVSLDALKDARVLIEDNTFEGFHYGVHATRLDEDVSWTVRGNAYGAAQYAVWYDDSVRSPPQGEDV